MNYLSHYFADSKPGQPYYNFGLALPDLIGATQRNWRPASAAPAMVADELVQLWEGYRQHLAGDAHFHSSAFFRERSKYIRQQFALHGMRMPGIRQFFAAHVLLEMLLDRQLIKAYPKLPVNFYADMDKIERKWVMDFFGSSGQGVPDNFFPFFEQFREKQFLYTYTDDDKLLYAFNRIMQRARQQSLIAGEAGSLYRLIQTIEAKLLAPFELEFGKK